MKSGETPLKIRLLLLTSFVTGTILMSLEMVGSRLLAPYFGNSIYVWGNLIGIFMLSLSIGYYVGGKLADKYKSVRFLYIIILSAAIYILLTLFIYKPLLSQLSKLGQMYGSVVATVALFALPMVLLSFVPPIIISLVSEGKKIGSAVGTVNSISTIGNIFGVYFSTFILIPSIGTRLTVHFCFATLLIISIIFLSSVSKKFLMLSFLLFAMFLTPTYSLDENVIHDEESLYNHIMVKRENGELRLYLNKEYHSVLNEENYFSGRYYETFLLMPLITKTDNMLILGMGGGTSIDQYKYYYPEISIDAVEIDGKVIEAAEAYFNVRNTEKVAIYEADARPFLSQKKKLYDAVEIDLFQGSPYIPFYVATKEFFEKVNSSMTDAAVGMMNVVAPGKNKDLLYSIEQTMLTVFPSLFRLDFNGANYVLIFSKENLKEKELSARLHSDLSEIQTIIGLFNITPVDVDPKVMILTDDLAPVEKLTKLTRST